MPLLSDLALDLYELGFPDKLLRNEIVSALKSGNVIELSLYLNRSEVVSATLQGRHVATSMPLRRITLSDIVAKDKYVGLKELYSTYGTRMGDYVGARLACMPIGYSEPAPGTVTNIVSEWTGAIPTSKRGFHYAFTQNQHGRQFVIWPTTPGLLSGLTAYDVRKIMRSMSEATYVINGGDIPTPLPDLHTASEWKMRRAPMAILAAKSPITIYTLSHKSGIHFIVGKIPDSHKAEFLEIDWAHRAYSDRTDMCTSEEFVPALLDAEDALRRHQVESAPVEIADEEPDEGRPLRVLNELPRARSILTGRRPRTPTMNFAEIEDAITTHMLIGPEVYNNQLRRKHGYHEIWNEDDPAVETEERTRERALSRYVRSYKSSIPDPHTAIIMPIRFTVDAHARGPGGLDAIFDSLQTTQHPAFREPIFMGFGL